MNEQNLKTPTPKEARERGKKGGIASGEARRKKRDLKRALEVLLEKDIIAKDGTVVSGAEAIVAQQFKKAMKGDTKAFEVIRDTAGQKPIERMVVAEVEQSVIDEVESIVLKNDD